MKKELSNYVPINRKFFDNPFWTKERVYSEAEAWLWLIKEARFEVSEGSKLIGTKVIKWKRGEIPASLRYLGTKWSWNKNRVDRFLELLENEGMITKRTQGGTDQTIITLCNYDSYNSLTEKAGQDTGHTRDTSGTATGQGRDNTKKDNKGNKVKKEYRPRVLLLESEHDTLLEKYGPDAVEWMLNKLDSYKESKGATYKSDYGAINQWVVEAWGKSGGVIGSERCPLGNTIDRTKHPGWPKDKPYTPSNIQRFNNNWPLRADNT